MNVEEPKDYKPSHSNPLIASIVEKIHNKLVTKFTHMKAAFKWFDTDLNGVINYHEFR